MKPGELGEWLAGLSPEELGNVFERLLELDRDPTRRRAWEAGLRELLKRYPHDCDCCSFLGRRDRWDLYHCKQRPAYGPTLIARFGPHGGDYDTWNPTIQGDPLEQPFLEAAERAIAAGLALRRPRR